MISVSHAKYSIHVCLIEIIVDLKRRFPSLNTVNIFSDVVPSQFKQQFSFANLTFLSNDYNVNLIWNFFSNGVDRGRVGTGGQVSAGSLSFIGRGRAEKRSHIRLRPIKEREPVETSRPVPTLDRGTVDGVRRTFKRLVWNDVMANWYIMHSARDSVNYVNSVEMNINTIYISGGSTISAIRSSSPL